MRFDYDTHATRRHLPHLEKRGKTYDVTFATIDRRQLPPAARTIALDCIVHDHELTYCLECAVVMEDHVHMILAPYEGWSLSEIMRRVKGNSARLINKLLERRGALWQEESFDRIIRDDENLQKKCEYVCRNPVAEGLVECVDDYPWLWRRWKEGGQAGLPVLHAFRVD